MDINISKAEAFDRWIESLQILAGDEDNPTEEQRGAMAVTRRKMLDTYRASELRDVLWRLEQSSGHDVAAKLVEDNPDLDELLNATEATDG